MTNDNSCGSNPSACSTCFVGAPCKPPPPGCWPKGVLHQSAVIGAIEYILKMPDLAFNAFKIGNGFSKVVRNYQYWVEELKPARKKACCPYNSNTLAPVYFRMTEEACKQINDNADADPKEKALKGIHQEHAVPVAWVVKELISLRGRKGWTPANVQDIVRTSEVILVTSEQAKLLDGELDSPLLNALKAPVPNKFCLGLNSTMPKVNGVPWKIGDCHLARICKITKTIIGTRML